jgi:hypothetical protein
MFYLTAQKSLWWWSHFLVVFSKKVDFFHLKIINTKFFCQGFMVVLLPQEKHFQIPKMRAIIEHIILKSPPSLSKLLLKSFRPKQTCWRGIPSLPSSAAPATCFSVY